jgi:hypothetical protein
MLRLRRNAPGAHAGHHRHGRAGHPGWDPICFVSPAGYLYYFPALARLAFGRSGEDYYLTQFLFHLNEERVQAMSGEQRAVVLELLEHLREHHRYEDDAIFVRNELEDLIQVLDSYAACPDAPITWETIRIRRGEGRSL